MDLGSAPDFPPGGPVKDSRLQGDPELLSAGYGRTQVKSDNHHALTDLQGAVTASSVSWKTEIVYSHAPYDRDFMYTPPTFNLTYPTPIQPHQCCEERRNTTDLFGR